MAVAHDRVAPPLYAASYYMQGVAMFVALQTCGSMYREHSIQVCVKAALHWSHNHSFQPVHVLMKTLLR